MDIKIIRSNRKSFCIESKSDGFVVRTPKRATDIEINDFLNQHKRWIEKQKQRIEKHNEAISKIEPLTDDEISELKSKAEKLVLERVAYYAEIIGVKYGKVAVRTQKKRWGSCSYNGNLSFNCLLALAPKVVLDSVKEIELRYIERQGFPFWCGKIVVENNIDVFGENPVICFSLKGVSSIIVEINGIEKTYLYDGIIKLKEFKAYGRTKIKITIFNNLRNLLGPHHLKNGESVHVTPSDFYKEKCIWNIDDISKWDEDYCLIGSSVLFS